MQFRWNRDTPEAFLNHTTAKKQQYEIDRADIVRQFKGQIKRHVAFFYSKEFDEDTQIIIDTILYSPDFKKEAILVFTKNPTSKQLAPDANADWYYDATCYLATRQKDSLDLSFIGPNFRNYTIKEELRQLVRENYFRIFATEKDVKGAAYMYYNLNDIRFWSCKIWKEQEAKKREEKEFEEFKKKHPEDVYEPKQ